MFASVDFLLPSWLPKDADFGVPTWWWGGWDPTAILDQDYSHSFWWQENFAHLPHLPPRLLLFWDLPPKNFSLNFRLCFSKQMPLQNFLLSQSFSVMQSIVTRSWKLSESFGSVTRSTRSYLSLLALEKQHFLSGSKSYILWALWQQEYILLFN